jgi:hypothetical protein
MIPINLVLFHWRLMFDTKLKLRYLILDWKILTENSPIRTQRNDTQKLILVDLVDVDKVRVHRSGFLQLTMRDLKRRKDYSLILIESIITLSYITSHCTMAWQSNLFKYLMWSQITVRLSIRLTVSRQIDFKVFKPLKAKENILETNF